MTQEERAEYAAEYRRRNQAHIKMIKRDWYLKIRPPKPEEVAKVKVNVRNEIAQIENELLALNTLMLKEGHSINEFEFVVSRRNALLVRIQILKQRINRDIYQPSIAILR